ncbi:type VI secretion system lipoprotein TssJ [Falsiroseomonas sp.]|uniref:type VI secretion system lipoprotein TssJ n=1 Tax=Falsiroseomonas sp. TaxID=2870721 RepID=UPI003565D895
MRRRALLLSPGLAAALAVGCGGPPPPTQVALQLRAGADVNPDAAGAPKPIRVRILQLAGTSAFSQADYFAIDSDAAKALGADLLGSEEVVVSPGETVPVQFEAKPGTRFVGIVGSYFAYDRAGWRAWAPVRPNEDNTYAATLGATGLTLVEGAA